jgi:histidyl-tRNA synthetase
VPTDQPIIDQLPHSEDFLCDACRDHFAEVRRQLDAYGLAYRVSHRLVRGLDYYTRTTFEMLGTNLGAQNALLGGGRYDHLVKQLGGPDRPGIGFAAGLERLVLALPEGAGEIDVADAFVVALGDPSWSAARILARDLRRAGLTTLIDYEGRSSKSQMKRANRSRARHMLILGEDELASNQVTVKTMETGEQQTVTRADLVAHLRAVGTD